jgi:ribosomal protein S25
MVNCEICKQKISLSNIYVDKKTGKAQKYCRSCAETMKSEEKKDMTLNKEDEEKIQDITQDEEKIQDIAQEIQHFGNLPNSETDIVTRDMLVDSINSYLGENPLNIKDGDYCYIRIVGNHLEIGRAKVVMEE